MEGWLHLDHLIRLSRKWAWSVSRHYIVIDLDGLRKIMKYLVGVSVLQLLNTS